MTAKHTIQIEPASLDFGDVQLGGFAKHQIALVNSTPTSIPINLKIESANTHISFYTSLPAQAILKPSEHKNITVSFRPIISGHYLQNLVVSIQDSFEKQQVSLLGNGIHIPRNSLREVDLPRREIEKMKRHPVLSISNTEYLQGLEGHAGVHLEWYAAVSAGTHRKTVDANRRPKPGEVLLPPQVSGTDDWSLLHCFDVQQISPKWATDIGRTITEDIFLDDINEAISHTTSLCRQEPRTCKNYLNPKDHRLIDIVETVRAAGEIVEIETPDFTTKAVIISPPEISARYEQCFYMKAAVLVEADLADSRKVTNWYGVRTAPIPELGALWVRCYTPSIYSLKDRSPEYRVHFREEMVSPEDLKAIRERVRLYLGTET